jgi:hypothetical protein
MPTPFTVNQIVQCNENVFFFASNDDDYRYIRWDKRRVKWDILPTPNNNKSPITTMTVNPTQLIIGTKNGDIIPIDFSMLDSQRMPIVGEKRKRF